MYDDQAPQKAISAALSGNWKEALEINKTILQKNPNEIDALNRAARAYAELGNLTAARKTAKSVLKNDPFNPIAQKSLDKWRGLRKADELGSKPSSPNIFLEEPGKTKIVSLINIGAAKTLAKIDAGDTVRLNPHGHRISVLTQSGKYLGRLADNISARLKKLIRNGNQYEAFVKSIKKNEVKVFLKESFRSPKMADIPSFPAEKIDYVSFTPPELVHKRRSPEITDEETED